MPDSRQLFTGDTVTGIIEGEPPRQVYRGKTVIQIPIPYRPLKDSKPTARAKVRARDKAPVNQTPKTAKVSVFGGLDTPSSSTINTGRTPGFSPIESQSQVGPGDAGSVASVTSATQEQTATIQDIADKEAQSKTYLAAANFALTVMNAQSAYGAVSSAAQLNILEARRQGADSIERGGQRALEAQVEGQLAGEDALLALAAQGQDIQGANAQKVQGSLEDIGRYNALEEEINAIRESLGFDLEEVGINFQVDQAEIQRNSTILSAGLNLGASTFANSL